MEAQGHRDLARWAGDGRQDYARSGSQHPLSYEFLWTWAYDGEAGRHTIATLRRAPMQLIQVPNS